MLRIKLRFGLIVVWMEMKFSCVCVRVRVFLFFYFFIKKAQTVMLHDGIPVTRPLLKSEISPCTIQQKTKSF